MKESLEYRRLKAVLAGDRLNKPAEFEEVLQSELFGVLKNYFELAPDSVQVRCEASEQGVRFHIDGKAKAVRPFFRLPL